MPYTFDQEMHQFVRKKECDERFARERFAYLRENNIEK